MCEDSENTSRVVRIDGGDGFVDVELTGDEDPHTIIGVCDSSGNYSRVPLWLEDLENFIKVLQAQREKIQETFKQR